MDSVFIEKLKNTKLIAHRLGYKMTKYPENSLMVLKTIFNDKKLLDACDGFEFDICFTKNNVPVVIHDKYVDDVSDSIGLVKSYTISEIKSINFSFRKSLNNDNSYQFKIVTLEEILNFFNKNKKKLGNKIIKIESKDTFIFNNKNITILADIINKFPNLIDNIIHLSFYPKNLIELKKVQKNKGYLVTKSDLLISYKIVLYLSKYIKSLDYISLGIKSKDFPKISKENSKKVNKKILSDNISMKFSNVIDENILGYVIEKYGSASIFVLNNENDIKEFYSRVSSDFFSKNKDKIIFTTDNPYYIRNLNYTNNKNLV